MAAGHITTAALTPVPHPTEKQLKHTLKNTKYSHPGPLARTILSTVEVFTDLKPSVKEYSYPNGKRTDLMQLTGTLPVNIVDQQYNIPIRVWLQRGHPKDKPLVYVNPTSDMALASVSYVERDGRIAVPYLAEWKEGRSELKTLLQVIKFKFSQQCPVYTVRKTPLVPGTSSGSSTLPRVMSVGHNYSPRTASGLTYSPTRDDSAQCGHEQELKKLKREIEEKGVEIKMLKSHLETIKSELSLEKAQVEELKKSQRLNQRGSFTSGVIDAMQREMQQQIVEEKEMKQKYKKRLDTMITEITQAREEIGILRVDKEDYQQRMRMANTELQHTKKRMLELRNELSTVKGRVESAETKLAQEEAESESLRRRLKEQDEEFLKISEEHEDRKQKREQYESELSQAAGGSQAEEVEELKQRLVESEEKLALAIQKALEIEKEKEELFNSFLAQVSQTSLMEQQLFDERQQLQLQLDGTMLQMEEPLTGEHSPLKVDDSADSAELPEIEEEKASHKELEVKEEMAEKIEGEKSDLEEGKEILDGGKHILEENRDQKNLDVEQLSSDTELNLRHTIDELRMELAEKKSVETKEASVQVAAEGSSLRERLENLQSTLEAQEKDEKRLRAEFGSLQKELSTTKEYAAKVKAKLENELERSKMTSQLEAELMERACVISQLTGEKVTLQFKVKELQQLVCKIKEEMRKLNDKHETVILEKSSTVDQLTTERSELLRKLQELQTRMHESPQQSEPQISLKDVISYEEIKLTQHMLGTGAWGYVVKGKFRGKAVAVKCLHNDILSQFSKAQIQREISIMAELRHPNLVLFIAAVMDAPTGPMIITELLSYTLRRAYQERLITTSLEKMSVMLEVALALNYLHLHHKPIMHRDISSANVLLEELANKQWRAKLSDFGSANLVRLASTPGEGALVYSAPEMRTGAHKPQDPSADVYSYGVLFCEVMTACFPGDRSGLRAMVDTVRTQSRIVSEIIESCLSENPSNRPAMGLIIAQLDVLISTRINT